MQFHPDRADFDELFERALDLELVEEGDEINLEDLKALLSDLFNGY